MSLFKKLFSSINPASEVEKDKDNNNFSLENDATLEEQFIYNFNKNGGKCIA